MEECSATLFALLARFSIIFVTTAATIHTAIATTISATTASTLRCYAQALRTVVCMDVLTRLATHTPLWGVFNQPGVLWLITSSQPGWGGSTAVAGHSDTSPHFYSWVFGDMSYGLVFRPEAGKRKAAAPPKYLWDALRWQHCAPGEPHAY